MKTNSGMGCEVSQPARIEPASVDLEWNLEKKSGEQLRQLEGGHFFLQCISVHFCPSSDSKTEPMSTSSLNKQSRDFNHTHSLTSM